MSDHPNILLIVCDQLSATALQAWGNPFDRATTIDGIVRGGVRFAQAYTPCPLCMPARASFWTGRYPHQTRVRSNGGQEPPGRIPDAMPTLGDVFNAAGYHTVHFGKTHDGGSLRGFQTFPHVICPVDAEPAWPLNNDTYIDRGTRKQVVSFLDSYHGKSPYLAVADLSNPHNICGWVGENAGPHRDVPVDGPLPLLPGNLYIDDISRRPLPVRYVCCAHVRQSQIGEWDEDNIRHYLRAYHHYIQRVNDEIQRILDAWHDRDDARDTLLVFWADHGDAMCGRWMATKHTTFYDETTHVPLAFSGPGIGGADRIVDGPVSLLDLLPTLCDYAGLSTPEGVEGRSLMPWLRQARTDTPHPAVFSQWHTAGAFTVEPGRMVRSARYKYTHYLEGPGEELYDLHTDPGETRTLVDDPGHAAVLERHRALLRDYVRRTDDDYFSLRGKAAPRWRRHQPGYRNHRGPAAPRAKDIT